MTHTLGPLTITDPSPGLDRTIDDGGDFAIIDADNHVIGQAHNLVARGVSRPAKANATLWAAAPELLEALKAIATDCPQAADKKFISVRSLRRVLRDAAELARAAIEKAGS